MEWKEGIRPEGGDESGGAIDFEAPGYSVLRQGHLDTFLGKLMRNPLIIIGILAMVLILGGLGLWGLSAGPTSDDAQHLARLESQLAQLGQRLNILENRPVAVIDPEGVQKKIDGMLQRLDRTEATLAQRLSAVEQQLKQREPAPAKPATAAAAAPAPKKAVKAAVRTYTVKPGDTLYSISRSTGISVAQLRQVNKLKPDAAIHPGDELDLAP